MTKAEMEKIAELAAEKAVRHVLTDLGIEHEEPYEMQADMNYLRDLRKSCDQVKNYGLRAVITTLIFAALGAFWLGFKNSLGQ